MKTLEIQQNFSDRRANKGKGGQKGAGSNQSKHQVSNTGRPQANRPSNLTDKNNFKSKFDSNKNIRSTLNNTSNDTSKFSNKHSYKNKFSSNFNTSRDESKFANNRKFGKNRAMPRHIVEGNNNDDGGESKTHSNKNDAPIATPLRRKVAPSLGAQRRHQPVMERVVRDPRFDDLSGKLDQTSFSKNYKFLEEMKEKERTHLFNKMRATKDPEERKNMKLAIQRIDNQSREKKMANETQLKKAEQRKMTIEALKQGNKPYFKKNSEIQLELYAKHFDALKKEKRLDKYLERKEKSKRAKELFSK